jgi:hypothetical protein
MDDREKNIDAARAICLPHFLETASRLRTAGLSERSAALAIFEMTLLFVGGDLPVLLDRAGERIARLRDRLAAEGFEDKQISLVMAEVAAMSRGIATALEDKTKLPSFAGWMIGHG